MFRLVADITELNIDQVKLPKIPGLGMLMKLPNKQKISMIVSVLNAQKGQFLPKWQVQLPVLCFPAADIRRPFWSAPFCESKQNAA